MSIRDAMHQSLRRAAVGAAIEDLLARWVADDRTSQLGNIDDLTAQLAATCAPFGVESWLTVESIEVDHGGIVDTYLLDPVLSETITQRWWVDVDDDTSEPMFDESLELLDDSDYEERWGDQ